MKQDEGSVLPNCQRQRIKLDVSFSDMEQKSSSPVNEDKAGGCCTR